MLAEDLPLFFNTVEFADDALFDGVDVAVIFEKHYATSGQGMGFTSTRPAIMIETSLIGANPVGKPVEHDDISYKVAAIDPDGSDRWLTVLLLELA